jgi:hypothetical protein
MQGACALVVDLVALERLYLEEDECHGGPIPKTTEPFSVRSMKPPDGPYEASSRGL